MEQKYDFRTKTFIIYIILTLILTLLNFNYMLPFSLNSVHIFNLVFFGFCLFLLINKNMRPKPYAWIIALLPSLWSLFSPLRPAINPELYSGSVPTMILTLKYGDITTAMLQLVASLVPFLVIIISLTKLLKYEYKVFDFAIGITFAFFVILESSPIYSLIMGAEIRLAELIQTIIISLIFVISMVYWHKTDNRNLI